MKRDEIERALSAADPVDRGRLDRVDLEAMEADLLADLEADPPGPALAAAPPRLRRSRRFALALGPAALAFAIAAVVLLAGGGSEQTSQAYGAELVRFAESTPLLLLEGPGWRVQNVYEAPRGAYHAESDRAEGSMEFVTGKPIPYESVRIKCVHETMSKNGKYPVCTAQSESGMFPPSVRQRRVELRWFHGSLEDSLAMAHEMAHPHGQSWTRLPVLATTADVDTRAEFYVNQGEPGNRQMTALWSEDGYVLELKAAVPDLAGFEERLEWLKRVDSQTWLDAMPAKVVKAADHDAAVREMLKDIPVPKGFEPSQIPDEGLTTDRYQVGAVRHRNRLLPLVPAVGRGAQDRRQRGGGRSRKGDGDLEALGDPARDGEGRRLSGNGLGAGEGDAERRLGLERAQPSAVAQAEGLGCARWGMPVLPWKQRRQSERAHST